jgi:hypothetical protein
MKNDPFATSGLPKLSSNNDESLSRDRVAKSGQQIEEKILILVADDSADNVAMISLDLQQLGYRVVTASNGEDAIRVATQTRPKLILMDISMPDSGWPGCNPQDSRRQRIERHSNNCGYRVRHRRFSASSLRCGSVWLFNQTYPSGPDASIDRPATVTRRIG